MITMAISKYLITETNTKRDEVNRWSVKKSNRSSKEKIRFDDHE